MSSRSEMDTPAMVAVVILGLVLIAVSVPFLGSDGGDGTTYSIRWSEEEAGSATAPVGAAGSETTVRVAVTDSLPSNATVAVDCTDGATPPLTQPATISWVLYEGAEEKGRGTFTCGGTNEETVAQEDHPDVGSAKAGSAADARAEAYASADNETVEYRAVFSWTRPGGTPLPVPAAFTGTYSLTIDQWTATAVEPDQEVPR